MLPPSDPTSEDTSAKSTPDETEVFAGMSSDALTNEVSALASMMGVYPKSKSLEKDDGANMPE